MGVAGTCANTFCLRCLACLPAPPSCRRQSEAEVKARESKLAAALEEAQRLRRLVEECKAASSARAGVSREEHARVVAENSQLAAQVGAADCCCLTGVHSLQTPMPATDSPVLFTGLHVGLLRPYTSLAVQL